MPTLRPEDRKTLLGYTARPGSRYDEAASALDFHECACVRNHPADFRGYAEFVTDGPV